MKRVLAHVLAATGGAAAWIAACRVSGHPEAWDGPLYPEAVLPALALLAAVLGAWVRERPAPLGIAVGLGQMVGLAVTRGPDPLWPVDVGILAALAVPMGLCAWIGAGLRRLGGSAARLGRSAAARCQRRPPRPADAPAVAASPAAADSFATGPAGRARLACDRFRRRLAGRRSGNLAGRASRRAGRGA